ncbi:MAG TPA: 6-phosphogluconolactonase [Candidatus Binataceae bacterium]|nr:6-phosphogluconolactonase [Candidatus Binataceae bacterium]
MSERQIIILDTAEELFVRAAEEIAHIAGEAICMHGEFTIALTGGTTPARTYELLATRFELSVDWKEVQFYWGDDRSVPPDDPSSNYGMANRTMLSKLKLKPEQIHRVRGEDKPQDAAREYEAELRKNFNLSEGQFPRFDLMLLGLGDNCHMLSLFPGIPELHEQHRLVVPVEVEDKIRHRVTMTAPVMNNSARIMFLVSGANKAAAVKRVLEGNDNPDQVPAHLVAPKDGVVIWMIDKSAASQLSQLTLAKH